MGTATKRILILSPRPNWGGASQVLLNLLDIEYSNSKKPQFLFLFEENGPAIADFQKRGFVYIFPIEKYPLLRKIARRFLRKTYGLFKFWYTKWIIHSQSPDLLYINSLSQTPSLKAALSCRTPLVLHAHEMDFLVTMKLPDAFVYKALDKTKLLIACAEAVASFYERTYNFPIEKTFVLHGPVNWERLANNSPEYNNKSELETSTIILGVVANISYLKAPDVLIEAISHVKKTYQGLKKIIVKWLGVPSQHSAYYLSILSLVRTKGLEEDIRFLSVSSETASFYMNIDMLIVPSRLEAFPLVILEAMLFEKPVVAMDVGGVREVVDAETGYLVKDRTPEGLAEGILYFLESEERRQRAGRAGRRRVLEQFEAQVQAPKWLKLLESI